MQHFSLSRLHALQSPAPLAEELTTRIELAREFVGHRRFTSATQHVRQAVAILGAGFGEAASVPPSQALAPLDAAFGDAVATLRSAHRAEIVSIPVQQLLQRASATMVAHRALARRLDELLTPEDDGRRAPLLEPMAMDGFSRMLADAVEDSRAFCREKHGDSPEVEMREEPAGGGGGGGGGAMLLVPQYVTFALQELLKNAQGAHIRHAGGADRLDSLPPLGVSYGITEDGASAFVRVRDHGGGLGDACACSRFLYSTRPEREPTYTYSRNFGAAFEGLGVGLPLAHTHAAWCGGGLAVRSVHGEGVTSTLRFDASGERSDPPWPWPPVAL